MSEKRRTLASVRGRSRYLEIASASGRLPLQARIFMIGSYTPLPPGSPRGFIHQLFNRRRTLKQRTCSERRQLTLPVPPSLPPEAESGHMLRVATSGLVGRARGTARDELHYPILRRDRDHVGNVAPRAVEQT